MRQTQRYWDGTQWTAHVAPLAPGAAAAPSTVEPLSSADNHGPATPEHWLLPIGRSWQSVTVGYLGFVCLIAWIVPVFGIIMGAATIALGFWAIRLAANGGHGRGRAAFGIVCGAVAIAAAVAVLAAGGIS